MKNSEYLCELLTPIEPTAAHQYLESDRYMMQVKEDGERLIVEKYAGKLFGFDRQGQITAIPRHLAIALDGLADDFMLDGERIGFGEESYYVVWDLLRYEEDDLRGFAYAERFGQLSALLAHNDEFGPFRLVRTFETKEEKTRGIVDLYNAGAEGVCFKDTLAPFATGRAKQHFKLKFWESATCRVADKADREDARWDKRSIALEMCTVDGRQINWHATGFCSIHSSRSLPAVGSFVEIRYLYAQRDGLYQPSFIGIRTDVNAADCSLEQLKWQKSQGVL